MYKTQQLADAEIANRCKLDALNPELKPFVALYNQKEDSFTIYPKVYTMVIKAMRTGTLAYKKPCDFFEDTDKNLIFAVSRIGRLIMDVPQEFCSDPVYFKEYAKAKWHFEKPHMFMAKIALACNLRIAFADILGGVISYEEARCELEFNQTNIKSPEVATVSIPPQPGDFRIPPTPATIADIVAKVFPK